MSYITRWCHLDIRLFIFMGCIGYVELGLCHCSRLRRSRVIGDSFSEFRHIESRKSKQCIALLAHDKDVCVVVVVELSVLCIIHVYVLVHLWPCRCASRKVKSRVIGDSF